MKTATLILLLSSFTYVFAQPPDTLWTRAVRTTSPGVEACAVCLTQDGGYAVAGVCCSWYSHTMFFSGFAAKFGREGEMQWQWIDHLTGMTSNAILDVKEVADGGFFLVGRTNNYGMSFDQCLWAVRLDAEGDTVWYRVYPEDWMPFGGGRAVALTPDGGFLIAGVGEFSLCKLDSSGNLLWQRNWGMSLEDIAPLSDGNYICVGRSDSGGPACLMVKVTAEGDTLWTRDCETDFDEIVNGVTATADGGFAICGSFQVLSYPRDMFLALKTSDGDHLMTRGYECYPCEAMDIRQTYDGGFVLAGSVTFNGQTGDSTCIGVLKTDPNLDQRWLKTWGGTGNDGANSVVQDSDSGYVVAGHWGNDSWYIAKLAADPLEVDERNVAASPSKLTLRCAPNPFNPSTTLSFTFLRPARARLAVYDVSGREVRVVADENFTPGEHRILFDASDLPSGIFFARLQGGEFAATQKLLLLK